MPRRRLSKYKPSLPWESTVSHLFGWTRGTSAAKFLTPKGQPLNSLGKGTPFVPAAHGSDGKKVTDREGVDGLSVSGRGCIRTPARQGRTFHPFRFEDQGIASRHHPEFGTPVSNRRCG